jgi:hypothetical protein
MVHMCVLLHVWHNQKIEDFVKQIEVGNLKLWVRVLEVGKFLNLHILEVGKYVVRCSNTLKVGLRSTICVSMSITMKKKYNRITCACPVSWVLTMNWNLRLTIKVLHFWVILSQL